MNKKIIISTKLINDLISMNMAKKEMTSQLYFNNIWREIRDFNRLMCHKNDKLKYKVVKKIGQVNTKGYSKTYRYWR